MCSEFLYMQFVLYKVYTRIFHIIEVFKKLLDKLRIFQLFKKKWKKIFRIFNKQFKN